LQRRLKDGEMGGVEFRGEEKRSNVGMIVATYMKHQPISGK
jgi:hypothetical protein